MKTLLRRLDRPLTLALPLGVFACFILLPFYWMLNTSLKTNRAIITPPITYLPSPATVANFRTAWMQVGFDRFFLNSIIISAGVMVCAVILSIMAAYAMTRFDFRGKALVVVVLLCTQFLPRAMLLIPLFTIFKNLGLINSLGSVVLACLAFQLPFNSVLMTGFMSQVPYEIEEAAMIDGCSRFRAVLHVVLPMLAPGVVAASSFAFIDSWKEYLFPLMFLNGKSKQTLSVGLSFMIGEFSVDYGTLAAGCLIAVLPPVLLFCYIQRYLVQGMALGAVKG
jgi:multiple sugar transport system permease protein